jgi:cobalamin biosynthesis Mg chelatase CobN
VTESPSSARRSEETAARSASRHAAAYPGTPRWVKVGAIVAVLVIVLVLAVMILSGGEHGPLRHVLWAAGTITIGSVVPRL